MTTRLPSPSAIQGLSAAFFFAASAQLASKCMSGITAWQLEYSNATLLIWPLFLAIFLFSVVSFWVATRLLYNRAHSVLHGIVLGWLLLLASGSRLAAWVYTIFDGLHLFPGFWLQFLYEWTFPVVLCAVVLTLLYKARSQQQYSAQPFPGSPNTA